ncbi:MAG: DUF5691 domain-containing protein [Pseudomonadota bacterium]
MRDLAQDIAQDLARIKGRWMIGGPALDQAPADWQAMAVGDAEDELALLAIVGQATQLLFRPVPQDARPSKRLPRLSLPPLPDALRPMFRRLMDVAKPTGQQKTLILHLMAARGATVHPADWMPASVDDLPEVYAPWSDWRDRTAEDRPELLNAESWDDWMPAERRLALVAMRRDDPAQALALIAQHAPSLAAEQRYRLIQCLDVGLSVADAAFLRGLESDRSAKVRGLAAHMLSQLGQIDDDPETAAELAGFFAVQAAGVLHRRKIVLPTKLKTKAQQARRRDLFGVVSAAGFAAALGLSVTEIVQMWTDKDPETIPDFAGMLARTGPADLIAPALDHLFSLSDISAASVAGLIDRLPSADRRRYVGRILQKDRSNLAPLVTCLQDDLGSIGLEVFAASGVLTTILQAAQAYAGAETASTDTDLKPALMHLGLLADAPTARALLDQLVGTGVISADPALAMLSFNAALTGETL